VGTTDEGRADTPDPVVASLVEAHNREREAEGLGPLKLDPKLTAAAKVHAQDMAEHETMSHDGSDGSTPAQRVKRQKYYYLRTGENVAAGQEAVDEVVRAWMNSPDHRKNILGDFTEMGAARVESEDGRPYWAVEFGTPRLRLDPEKAAGEVVERINDARAEEKLPALGVSSRLARVARETAEEWAEKDEIDQSQGAPDISEKIKRAGYAFRELNQSFASGPETAEELVKTMIENEQRVGSIFGKHRHVGVGYATAEDGTPYWIVIFGSPRGPR
jgi:uncharacterized protein YkwD